jgi:hypothetical protein
MPTPCAFMRKVLDQAWTDTMRLWSVHPKYLDARGLVALWREALLAQALGEATAVWIATVNNPHRRAVEVQCAAGARCALSPVNSGEIVGA